MRPMSLYVYSVLTEFSPLDLSISTTVSAMARAMPSRHCSN